MKSLAYLGAVALGLTLGGFGSLDATPASTGAPAALSFSLGASSAEARPIDKARRTTRRVTRRNHAYHHGHHGHYSAEGGCGGGSCSRSVTRTGPYGGTATRDGEVSCGGGSCSGERTTSGPYGGSVTREGSVSRW